MLVMQGTLVVAADISEPGVCRSGRSDGPAGGEPEPEERNPPIRVPRSPENGPGEGFVRDRTATQQKPTSNCDPFPLSFFLVLWPAGGFDHVAAQSPFCVDGGFHCWVRPRSPARGRFVWSGLVCSSFFEKKLRLFLAPGVGLGAHLAVVIAGETASSGPRGRVVPSVRAAYGRIEIRAAGPPGPVGGSGEREPQKWSANVAPSRRPARSIGDSAHQR